MNQNTMSVKIAPTVLLPICLYCLNDIGVILKTVDTIGNCQRPVFSLGVSQHMHKITNL